MFDSTSRYNGIESATMEVRGGDGRLRTIAYKRQRLIPLATETEFIEHTVSEGERLDLLAARYLGDPTLFWQLCDFNGALDPEDLEVPGRVVRIPLMTR